MRHQLRFAVRHEVILGCRQILECLRDTACDCLDCCMVVRAMRAVCHWAMSSSREQYMQRLFLLDNRDLLLALHSHACRLATGMMMRCSSCCVR
jgi:hypothetical protein